MEVAARQRRAVGDRCNQWRRKNDNPRVPGALQAFDAENVAIELWSSTTNPSRDNYGNFAKFVLPLIVNGRVYVATSSDQLAVYGLAQ